MTTRTRRLRTGAARAAAIGTAVLAAAATAGPAAAAEAPLTLVRCTDGLCVVSAVDRAHDTDGDGTSDVEEERLGTDPKDPNSRPPVRELAGLAAKGASQDFLMGRYVVVGMPKTTGELGLPGITMPAAPAKAGLELHGFTVGGLDVRGSVAAFGSLSGGGAKPPVGDKASLYSGRTETTNNEMSFYSGGMVGVREHTHVEYDNGRTDDYFKDTLYDDDGSVLGITMSQSHTDKDGNVTDESWVQFDKDGQKTSGCSIGCPPPPEQDPDDNGPGEDPGGTPDDTPDDEPDNDPDGPDEPDDPDTPDPHDGDDEYISGEDDGAGVLTPGAVVAAIVRHGGNITYGPDRGFSPTAEDLAAVIAKQSGGEVIRTSGEDTAGVEGGWQAPQLDPGNVTYGPRPEVGGTGTPLPPWFGL